MLIQMMRIHGIDELPFEQSTGIELDSSLVDEGHLNPFGGRATYIKIYHRTISPSAEKLIGTKESLTGSIRTSSI